MISVRSFQLPSASLGLCRLILRRASVVGTVGSRETARYGSISTPRAAGLRLRGMTYTCTPRECQDAHCGQQEYRGGRSQEDDSIRRKLPGRELEKAFSWGTEPLLGVVCHPHPAASDMGAESPPGEAQ